ncbi:Alpha carbonic anhydrase domain superfamily [Sesbania bispinosa]|nr:Alpha carbonic anhydrase domain superfamily [Sesbania bispinosa]
MALCRLDLEVHMVHETPSGQTAVIGILYKIGKPDPFLASATTSVKQREGGLDLRHFFTPLDIMGGDRQRLNDSHRCPATTATRSTPDLCETEVVLAYGEQVDGARLNDLHPMQIASSVWPEITVRKTFFSH